jgi:AraC-like DNA-binding protein
LSHILQERHEKLTPSIMDEQQVLKGIFYMLYGGVAVLGMIACCYLLFRRNNAFASDITSSVRLRRWTAALFASITLSHLWYLPMYFLTSTDEVRLSYFIGGLLDCMLVLPLAIVVLFAMLQDRRRPLWPVVVMMMPIIVGVAWCIANRSGALLPLLLTYFLLMVIGIIIYMVRAIRRYGRWLRDNYADLEHKEVWQSFVVLSVILLAFAVYAFEIGGPAYDFVLQMANVVLICYLVWRVETLSDLNIQMPTDTAIAVDDAEDETVTTELAEDNGLSPTVNYNIGMLLKQYCEERQLYLQYDISIIQLAKQIGTNRSYLSRHFASEGITYNAYINGLRIQHFINLYSEAVGTHQPVTAQQLAHQSGFRSYTTFSAAFKKSMGMTATEWMRNIGE